MSSSRYPNLCNTRSLWEEFSGSVVALVVAITWLVRRPTPLGSALFAGTMTGPVCYSLRFLLAGRGHDATEFQEAQAALGLSYSGHAVDWLFVTLFVLATVFWFLRCRARPSPRLIGRLACGSGVAVVVVVLLQLINNAVFDPLFEAKAQDTPTPGHAQERQK